MKSAALILSILSLTTQVGNIGGFIPPQQISSLLPTTTISSSLQRKETTFSTAQTKATTSTTRFYIPNPDDIDDYDQADRVNLFLKPLTTKKETKKIENVHTTTDEEGKRILVAPSPDKEKDNKDDHVLLLTKQDEAQNKLKQNSNKIDKTTVSRSLLEARLALAMEADRQNSYRNGQNDDVIIPPPPTMSSSVATSVTTAQKNTNNDIVEQIENKKKAEEATARTLLETRLALEANQKEHHPVIRNSVDSSTTKGKEDDEATNRVIIVPPPPLTTVTTSETIPHHQVAATKGSNDRKAKQEATARALLETRLAMEAGLRSNRSNIDSNTENQEDEPISHIIVPPPPLTTSETMLHKYSDVTTDNTNSVDSTADQEDERIVIPPPHPSLVTTSKTKSRQQGAVAVDNEDRKAKEEATARTLLENRLAIDKPIGRIIIPQTMTHQSVVAADSDDRKAKAEATVRALLENRLAMEADLRNNQNNVDYQGDHPFSRVTVPLPPPPSLVTTSETKSHQQGAFAIDDDNRKAKEKATARSLLETRLAMKANFHTGRSAFLPKNEQEQVFKNSKKESAPEKPVESRLAREAFAELVKNEKDDVEIKFEIPPLASIQDLQQKNDVDLLTTVGAFLGKAALSVTKATMYAADAIIVDTLLNSTLLNSVSSALKTKKEKKTNLKSTLSSVGSSVGLMLKCFTSSNSAKKTVAALSETTNHVLSACTVLTALSLKKSGDLKAYIERSQKEHIVHAQEQKRIAAEIQDAKKTLAKAQKIIEEEHDIAGAKQEMQVAADILVLEKLEKDYIREMEQEKTPEKADTTRNYFFAGGAKERHDSTSTMFFANPEE